MVFEHINKNHRVQNQNDFSSFVKSEFILSQNRNIISENSKEKEI
jgi:hypothetical protein